MRGNHEFNCKNTLGWARIRGETRNQREKHKKRNEKDRPKTVSLLGALFKAVKP